MKSFYAHTIKITNFARTDFDSIEKILKSGYVLSRNKIKELGEKKVSDISQNIVFNGVDYVSLCDLRKKHDSYSSYNLFTKRGLSLLFDHKIHVIKPIYICHEKNLIYNMQTLAYSVNRYSDLTDEVQVRDGISLDYLRGLCVPLSLLEEFHMRGYCEYYLNYLQELLEKYNRIVPIYDIDNNKLRKIKKIT